MTIDRTCADDAGADGRDGNGRPVEVPLRAPVLPPAPAAPAAAVGVLSPGDRRLATSMRPAGTTGEGDESAPDDLRGLARPLPDRRLRIDTPHESAFKRTLFLFVALAVAGLHVAFTHHYWAPAHWGNNQNAYLSAGKLLATTGTTGFLPSSPFEFVGWMWNMADETATDRVGGWYYPKYPIGVPLLNAVAYKAGWWYGSWTSGGNERVALESAVNFMLKVPPLCVTAATLAVFFITRLLAGSFAAVLAMIMYCLLTVVIVLTNNPYSHAADMAFVTWGMYALLKWWQHGGWWRGAIAGLLIGYAATIRYTEGLLVLPLAAAAITTVRWKSLRSYLRAAVPMLAWLAPLLFLVIYNKLTIGEFTGYDSTNESTGFTLAELDRKWRWGIDQFYNTGLYFFLPLSLFGMLMLFRWNWRLGLWMALWFVPGTVLYLSYYWGMNLPVWGFLRFFASVLPAGVIAAAWAMQRAAEGATPATFLGPEGEGFSARRAALVGLATVALGAGGYFLTQYLVKPDKAGDALPAILWLGAAGGAIVGASVAAAGRGVAAPIAMGAFAAFPSAINLDVSVGPLERDFTIATNISQVGTQCRMAIPRGSVVFGHSQYLHNYLQFAGDYTLIGGDYLQGGRPVPGIGRGGDDNPTPIQPSRKKLVDKVYGEMNRDARFAEARRIIDDAFAAGKRVFIVQESAGAGALRDALVQYAGGVKPVVVARWTDPARMPAAAMAALGTIGRDGWARRELWKWQIVELVKADPPPVEASIADAPATQPATQPSTAPSLSRRS